MIRLTQPAMGVARHVLRRPIALVLAGYLAFYLVLFAHLPARDELPGHCNTWLGIALANTYANDIADLVREPSGVAMFPAEDIHDFGEPAPGAAAIFLLPRLFGLGDIGAYYVFISLLFALSAFGVFLLATTYVDRLAAAIVAGFAFSCSTFALANIDDPMVVFVLLPALCLFFLRRYLASGGRRDLWLAAVLGGAQIYFSTYLFAYQTVAVAVAVAFAARRLVLDGQERRRLLAAMLAYLAIAAPLAVSTLDAAYTAGFELASGAARELGVATFGLQLRHLASAMPGVLLYPVDLPDPDSLQFWIASRARAFPGLVMTGLAALGLGHGLCGKRRSAAVALAVIGLLGMLLAWGAIQVGPVRLAPPSSYLSLVVPPVALLRVVLRAWVLALLAGALFGALGISVLLDRLRLARPLAVAAVVGAVMLVHAVEVMPVPLPGWPAWRLANPPLGYVDYLRRAEHTIVDLPSRRILAKESLGRPLSPFNRELIYMNWQTRHRRNTLNGVHGFVPASRKRLQVSIEHLPAPPAVGALRAAGVDTLVFHRSLTFEDETDLLDKLRSSPQLRPVLEDDDVVIFRIAAPLSG